MQLSSEEYNSVEEEQGIVVTELCIRKSNNSEVVEVNPHSAPVMTRTKFSHLR